MREERRVALTLRLYRALAAAFPQEFRNVYGEALEQTAEDAVEPVWKEHGLGGVVRLLADIALRIPAEYASEVRQDVRYGLRMLRASPGFTAVAVVSLTLGIGVATAAFSEMNGFLLRDVPGVARPDELVADKSPMSYETYRRFREQDGLFSGMLAYAAPVAFGVQVGSRAERVWGHVATASYFGTLGVGPALGRFFDDRETGVVVVSHTLWRERLGADPAIVGRTLRVNGRACTVIGVGPENFQGASPLMYSADLWLPIEAGREIAPELAGGALDRYDSRILHVVARLRPGVTPARTEAALEAIVRKLDEEHGDPERDRKGRRAAFGQGGKLMPLEKKDLPLVTSFFAVLGGMILLIASSNVANMMLARAAGRRKEIAMRLALGAGRGRLARQLLVESMLVAAASGALGFVCASWLMRLASRAPLPYPMPLHYDLTPDGRVAVFCLGLTIFTGLVFGLLPALRATRTDLTPALKEGGNVPFGRHRRFNMRNVLMVSQVAASLALLLITGFLVIGHRRLTVMNVGFDASRMTLLSLDPIRDGYTPARTQDVFEKLLDRAKRLPSVSAASFADAVPMTMIGKPSTLFWALMDGGKALRWGRRYGVSRDFFDTLGIPIVRGRGFRPDDETNSSMSAIVSERLARECWPGQDPVGRRIEIGEDDLPAFMFAGAQGPPRQTVGRARTLEVIGVAKDVQDGLVLRAADAPPLVYALLRPADYARPPSAGITLVVRGVPGADAATAVRREIQAVDSQVTVFGVRTLADCIDQITSAVRAALWTYGVIGLFGLVLASVGLAGLTAYTVVQRRRELGIRIAIGAGRADVLRLVMREGLALVTVGSVIGFVLARAGIRAMGAIMSEIARTAGTSTSDPMLLVGAPALLAGVALVACYWPARASTRIDPVEALRAE